MTGRTRADMIGERAAETLRRVRKILEEHRDALSAWQESFLCGLEERLDTYGERAFVGAAQLNRLSEIEGRIARDAWR